LIEVLVAVIKKDQEPIPCFKNLWYDTLQYIAISKKDFHQNYFILTKNIFDMYAILPKTAQWLKMAIIKHYRLLAKKKKKFASC